MNAKKKRRLAFAAALIGGGCGRRRVIVYGLGQNTMYFRSPSDVAAKEVGEGLPSGLAGWWKKAAFSTVRARRCIFASPTARPLFRPTLTASCRLLFREGQGVVATGAMDASGTFIASEVLAKHDEKYMPPEVVSGPEAQRPLAGKREMRRSR